MIEKILEWFWPPLRWQRIVRQLNAQERKACAELYVHYWTKVWPAQRYAEYHRPMFITKFVKPVKDAA